MMGRVKTLPYCLYYFNLFSKVDALKDVNLTRLNPYSDVSTNDFGRSSQGTTSPFLSLFSRNSLVRLDVEVLSRSKIPIILFSRTAISLPIERYIVSTSVGEGLDPPRHPPGDAIFIHYNNNLYPIVWDWYQYSSKSFHTHPFHVLHDHDKIFAIPVLQDPSYE